jgi:hypothetical protein
LLAALQKTFGVKTNAAVIRKALALARSVTTAGPVSVRTRLLRGGGL